MHRTTAGRGPTGPGKIRLLATAEGCEPAEIIVTVENESAA